MNALIEIIKAVALMFLLGLSILLFARVAAEYKDKEKSGFDKLYNKIVGVKGTKFNRL